MIRIPAAHPTHPRVDVVTTDGRVLVGTPTTGATLNNRLGAANVPSQDVEHYVLVPAGATTITEADRMMNLWTPDLDAAVERIEAEINRPTG